MMRKIEHLRLSVRRVWRVLATVKDAPMGRSGRRYPDIWRPKSPGATGEMRSLPRMNKAVSLNNSVILTWHTTALPPDGTLLYELHTWYIFFGVTSKVFFNNQN